MTRKGRTEVLIMFWEKLCVAFMLTLHAKKHQITLIHHFGFQTSSLTHEIVNYASLLQHCEFRMRGHYHCLRPGCYFVTNITTKLPWHVKKHEKAERRAANGFKYFTKREECGRLGKQKWLLILYEFLPFHLCPYVLTSSHKPFMSRRCSFSLYIYQKRCVD